MCNSKPILGYWDFRGLCNPIRFLLAYLDVEHEQKLYPFAKPPHSTQHWLQARTTLGLDFPNIPYWIDGDIKLTESQAILKHIARCYDPKGTLIPSDAEALRKVEMLEGVCYDAFHSLLWFCFHIDGAELDSCLERNKTTLENLSKYIGENWWAIGSEITYVDFWLYETLYMHLQYNKNWVTPHANLIEFMRRFESFEGIAKYLKSSNYIKAPCNAPIAKRPFGQF